MNLNQPDVSSSDIHMHFHSQNVEASSYETYGSVKRQTKECIEEPECQNRDTSQCGSLSQFEKELQSSVKVSMSCEPIRVCSSFQKQVAGSCSPSDSNNSVEVMHLDTQYKDQQRNDAVEQCKQRTYEVMQHLDEVVHTPSILKVSEPVLSIRIGSDVLSSHQFKVQQKNSESTNTPKTACRSGLKAKIKTPVVIVTTVHEKNSKKQKQKKQHEYQPSFVTDSGRRKKRPRKNEVDELFDKESLQKQRQVDRKLGQGAYTDLGSSDDIDNCENTHKNKTFTEERKSTENDKTTENHVDNAILMVKANVEDVHNAKKRIQDGSLTLSKNERVMLKTLKRKDMFSDHTVTSKQLCKPGVEFSLTKTGKGVGQQNKRHDKLTSFSLFDQESISAKNDGLSTCELENNTQCVNVTNRNSPMKLASYRKMKFKKNKKGSCNDDNNETKEIILSNSYVVAEFNNGDTNDTENIASVQMGIGHLPEKKSIFTDKRRKAHINANSEKLKKIKKKSSYHSIINDDRTVDAKTKGTTKTDQEPSIVKGRKDNTKMRSKSRKLPNAEDDTTTLQCEKNSECFPEVVEEINIRKNDKQKNEELINENDDIVLKSTFDEKQNENIKRSVFKSTFEAKQNENIKRSSNKFRNKTPKNKKLSQNSDKKKFKQLSVHSSAIAIKKVEMCIEKGQKDHTKRRSKKKKMPSALEDIKSRQNEKNTDCNPEDEEINIRYNDKENYEWSNENDDVIIKSTFDDKQDEKIKGNSNNLRNKTPKARSSTQSLTKNFHERQNKIDGKNADNDTCTGDKIREESMIPFLGIDNIENEDRYFNKKQNDNGEYSWKIDNVFNDEQNKITEYNLLHDQDKSEYEVAFSTREAISDSSQEMTGDGDSFDQQHIIKDFDVENCNSRDTIKIGKHTAVTKRKNCCSKNITYPRQPSFFKSRLLERHPQLSQNSGKKKFRHHSTNSRAIGMKKVEMYMLYSATDPLNLPSEKGDAVLDSDPYDFEKECESSPTKFEHHLKRSKTSLLKNKLINIKDKNRYTDATSSPSLHSYSNFNVPYIYDSDNFELDVPRFIKGNMCRSKANSDKSQGNNCSPQSYFDCERHKIKERKQKQDSPFKELTCGFDFPNCDSNESMREVIPDEENNNLFNISHIYEESESYQDKYEDLEFNTTGLVSGVSSEVRPRRSALKQKYLNISTSDGESLTASTGSCEEYETRHLKPRKLFNTDRTPVIRETKDDTSTSGSQMSTDENDKIIPQRSLQPDSDRCGVRNILKTFGMDFQKQMQKRRNSLETLTRETFKSSCRQIRTSFDKMKTHRDSIFNNYLEKLLCELTDLQKDAQKLEGAEMDTLSFFEQKVAVLQNHRLHQEKKLKKLQQIQSSFIRSMSKAEIYASLKRKSVVDIMKKDLSSMQKKVLLELHQQELFNVKRNLQSMLTL